GCWSRSPEIGSLSRVSASRSPADLTIRAMGRWPMPAANPAPRRPRPTRPVAQPDPDSILAAALRRALLDETDPDVRLWLQRLLEVREGEPAQLERKRSWAT